MDDQEDTKHETQQDGFSIDIEPLFEDEDYRQASTQKFQSKRTGAYTDREDKLLCGGWMEIGQNPICGAEKKRGGGIFEKGRGVLS
jgi:hypothetical protein